jgi:hypothetical protein
MKYWHPHLPFGQHIFTSWEHGCKDGKFGLEPILFEGQMSSDFLQDLVCNGRSVYSKGCRKSHQSRIFDSFQFYPQFVQIDMASFRLSLRIIQPCIISFRLRSNESFYSRQFTVHELCKSLSSVVCEILPADHALTGCDTTSSFFGIEKNSMYTVHAKLCGYPPLLVCLPNNCNVTYHSDSTF